MIFILRVNTCCFIRLKSNSADTFFQLSESSESGMISFRKNYQSIFVFQYINCLNEYFIIAFKAAESIPYSVNRQDLKKIKDCCNDFLLKISALARKHSGLCL